jgi:hypothetical protein
LAGVIASLGEPKASLLRDFTSTRFYLHKNQNAPVAGDDVNFTEGAAIIAADNAVPQTFQVVDSKFFALTALL